jgi:hypothetical protein
MRTPSGATTSGRRNKIETPRPPSRGKSVTETSKGTELKCGVPTTVARRCGLLHEGGV